MEWFRTALAVQSTPTDANGGGVIVRVGAADCWNTASVICLPRRASRHFQYGFQAECGVLPCNDW